MAIDWKRIAEEIGNPREEGNRLEAGQRALEILIGEQNLREAVDHIISLAPGAFTAEIVMKIIRSRVAMRRCLEIYKSDSDIERARLAVFLLGSIADCTALPWIRDFLEDSDENVRVNGLRVLQTILYAYSAMSEGQLATAKELVSEALSSSDPALRERAAEIAEWLDGTMGDDSE
jgi:HEAT repeat protein